MIDLRIEAEVVIGNECADALAKRGADLGKISLQEDSDISSKTILFTL